MVVKKLSTKPARATAMSPTNAALVMGGGGGAPKFHTQPGSISGDVGTTVTFQASATGKPTITYQWQVDTGGGFANISGATSTSYTTDILVIGDDQNDYRCVATNSQGSTNSDTATLTVPSVYLAYSVGNQSDSDGDMVLLELGDNFKSGTKPYVFGATGLPTGLSIDTATGTISGDLDPDASESSPYSVVVTCTDADTASDTDSFTWTVANVPPVQVGKIPPQADQDENVISLDVSGYFASPDGGTLTFTATGLPTGLAIGLNDGIISGTITSGANASSPFTVTVTADDGTDSVVGDSFQWTVNEAAIAYGDFDGIDDTVALGTLYTAIPTTGDIVIETRFWIDAYKVSQHVFTMRGDATNWISFGTHRFGDTIGRCGVTFADVTGPVHASWNDNELLEASWNVLSVSWDSGTRTSTATLNGVSSTGTYDMLTPIGTGGFFGHRGNSTELLDGRIDYFKCGVSSVNEHVWEFNETSGTNVPDSGTGTAFDGTLAGDDGTNFWGGTGNRTPTLDLAIQDRTSNNLDVINLDISVSFSDPDGDTLTFSETSGLPAGLSCSTAGVISGTITDGEHLNSPFTCIIRATDPGGLYIEDTFQWTVQNPAAYTMWADADYGGGDSDGSESKPWTTIQEAVDAASSGDWIFATGTFQEKVTWTKSNVTLEFHPDAVLEPPAVAITWTAAPEIGLDVYVTTDIPSNPEILSYDGKTAGRMRGNSNEVMSPGGWGWVALSSPRTTWMITEYGTPGQQSYRTASPAFNFWEGIHSIWGQDGANTYFRHKDGTDPNTLPIRIAASTDYGISLYGPYANNIIRNGTVRGFGEGIRIRTADAIGNEVDSVTFTNHLYGLRLYYLVSGTHVHDCTFNGGIDTDAATGAWNDGTESGSIKEFLYEFWKYIYHGSSTNCSGMSLWTIGDDNVIENNHFSGGIDGISNYHDPGTSPVPDGTRIRGNTIENHCSIGMQFRPGCTDWQMYGNTYSNNNHCWRIHSQDTDLETEYHFFNNTLHLPPGVGSFFFNHWFTGNTTPISSQAYNIYHNSFSGGFNGVSYGPNGDPYGGLVNHHFVNNVFSAYNKIWERYILEIGTWDGNHNGSGNTADYGIPLEAWYGASNNDDFGTLVWTPQTSTAPDFVIPAGHPAENAAIALPVGFPTAGLSLGAGEDMGAVIP